MRACALLILVALSACASETPEEPASSAKAPAPGAKARGAKRFELLVPSGEIEQPPTEMRWRVGPGLIACRADILTEQGLPVWTSPPSDEGVATMPENVRASLKPGEPYLWKVVCSFSGLQLGSEYASFTVARP